MKDPFSLAEKYIEIPENDPNKKSATQETKPEAAADLPRAWKVEEIRSESGEVRAVLICSGILQDHLWVIYDRSFEPKDSLAIYYAEELPELKKKNLEELRQIHKVKLAFPWCRVIQEGPERLHEDQRKLNLER